jgi:hypothetical protein
VCSVSGTHTLPYDPCPCERRARQKASDGATGSADCSTSIGRSHDVCGVSGTDRPDRAMVPNPMKGRAPTVCDRPDRRAKEVWT